jgi:formylglycine-generating enzyme required for sulfatase activity
VFISYSRADRVWVDRLRQTMAPLLRAAGDEVVLWDDSQIRPGTMWLQAIETALARARVALLLVSAEFLASDFVMGREVPVLLAAAEREGVRILWVSLSPCFVDRTPIHAYQAVLPVDHYLDDMTEPQQRRALLRIAEEVHRALVEARRDQEERDRQARLEQEDRELRALRERQERERQARREQEERDRRERANQDRLEREERQQRARREIEEREQRARRERKERELADARRRPLQTELPEQLNTVGQGAPQAARTLFTRRRLLLGAGVPLAALGLARITANSGGLSRLPFTGTRSLSPVAPTASGPLTLQTTHGWLERRSMGWRIQTRPIQVPGTAELLAPGVPLLLVRIPAGRFVMGSPPGELERSNVEGPQREVRLAEFWMGQTPITQAQWRVVAGWPKVERELKADPSRFKGPDRPVESVSWEDAMEFCRRLSQHTGRTYTMPSEAQWEYACRAGTATPFAFGETITTELANYNGNYTFDTGPKGIFRKQSTDVASFVANAWGLHDMHGNVWEWCLDHWHESFVGAPSDGTAWLNSKYQSGSNRLLRGGSWVDFPRDCRSAFRVHYEPDYVYGFVGFRVVCLPQGRST